MEDMPRAEVPLKVLVVDDQADSADAVAFMLSLMGHDVHTAYGPREALELFRELQPSVVFMDISMPELSGLEAAARIRSLPEGTSTTIIALTGLGHEQDRRRSREASIDHHLVKPASPAVLHRLLSGIHPGGGPAGGAARAARAGPPGGGQGPRPFPPTKEPTPAAALRC
jgi:CheY-like chemotaxis protein